MEKISLSRTEENVLAHLDQQQDRLISLLTRLVGYQTITPQDGQCAQSDDYVQLSNYVGGILQDLGADQVDIWEQDAAKLETFPGSGVNPQRDLSRMPVLAATLRGSGGGKSLILNGHYDVVPAGDRSTWSHDPFEGHISDGKFFGRGACDMKGGIAAMLISLQTLKELEIKLQGDLVVEVVPDEEMSCMGTLASCQRGYTADAAFIPEPTNMQVLIAMRGSFYGVIIVRGRSGHAEMTQPDWQQGGAVNAISKAQLVLAALDELNQHWQNSPEKQHDLLDPDMIVPVNISTDSDWAVTIPDKVKISFGVQTTSTQEAVCKEIEDFLKEALKRDAWLAAHPPEFEYEPVWHYSAEISPEEPIVELGLNILNYIGYDPQACGMGSLTDAIHLINYSKIPTISIGPADQPAHMADEYVEIKQLVDLSKTIALMLIRWCGVEG